MDELVRRRGPGWWPAPSLGSSPSRAGREPASWGRRGGAGGSRGRRASGGHAGRCEKSARRDSPRGGQRSPGVSRACRACRGTENVVPSFPRVRAVAAQEGGGRGSTVTPVTRASMAFVPSHPLDHTTSTEGSRDAARKDFTELTRTWKQSSPFPALPVLVRVMGLLCRRTESSNHLVETLTDVVWVGSGMCLQLVPQGVRVGTAVLRATASGTNGDFVV